MTDSQQGLAREADVEHHILTPLFADLGYARDDIAPKLPVDFNTGRQGRRAEADFVLFAAPNDVALVVVEAKRPGEDLAAARRQAESYASALHAPFVLLCDGERLEVWQRAAAAESQLTFACTIAQLPARMGELRLLLQKPAATAHAAALGAQPLQHLIRDFGAYERAEAQRTQAAVNVIARRLKPDWAPDEVPSPDLFSQAPRGALITAPSGLGKTSLGYALHRQALAQRLTPEGGPLPVHAALPEIGAGERILQFAVARLATRKPGFTEAALERIIADEGVLLLLDGFDRLPPSGQAAREVELRNLLRDYGEGLRIVVLSRATAAPQLDLPHLTLEPLDDGEQWQAVEAMGVLSPIEVLRRRSQVLAILCANPLLLSWTVRSQAETGRSPKALDDLFRHWLDTVLQADRRNPAETSRREAALLCLARQAVGGRVLLSTAMRSLKAEGLDAEIVNRLVACDALVVVGDVVEFQHEALADYLLALCISRLPPEEQEQQIEALNLDPDSLLPVLLMGLLDAHVAALALWRRLSGLELGRFLDVLRFRRNLEADFVAREGEARSVAVLTELADGYELVLGRYFPKMRQRLMSWLTGGRAEHLQVVGQVEGGGLTYGFQPCRPDAPKILISDPFRPDRVDGRIRHVNLAKAGLRFDSGRLLAIQDVFDACAEAMVHRDLIGGPQWRAERLLSQLAWIQLSLRHPLTPSSPLADWRQALADKGDEAIRRRLPRPIRISEILEDIDALIQAGEAALDDWYADLRDARRFRLSDARVAEIVQRKYKAGQEIYRELVDHSFPALRDELGFSATIPVRFIVVVDPAEPGDWRRSAHRRWRPVATWAEAGADVSFGQRPKFDLAYFEETRRDMERLGRSTRNSIFTWGGGDVLRSEGLTARSVAVESPAMQEACARLKTDLETIFRMMPGSDVDDD
ncbi:MULTISPECIES: NACHT domain-containing NTPase [unclassified Phenylobacterium]|uniref:NACHT domain-containing protein n=1 Tax=unclassified Phenylobacterium TaxID=2640670 RepID=UPI0009EA078A|nr:MULTISPECIES: type I restriction enzyme HsdR N-terminal domain-containing protein [unclassified Phenylobacterium]